MKCQPIWLIGFLFILPIYIQAQQLVFSTQNIQFATLTIPAVDSFKVVVTIQGLLTDSTLQVRNIISFDEAFTISKTNFNLTSNQPAEIWVRFKPKHNITIATQLLIVSNAANSSATITVSGAGKYANTYYAATQNLSEQPLKDALKTIITNGQSSCTYNSARDQLFMTIDNKKTNGQGATNNTLECVYTGRQAVGFTSRSDAQTNDNFNTEHTWPQSLFSSNAPMQCDLHHLFPTDETANSTRSNYPFGIVSNPSWTVGGSKYANNVFEPRDSHKGQVARAMMYFVLRYQDYSTFFAPQETILRQWHSQFKPTAIDIKRNADIFTYQNNRNPFIDHPEFLDRITLLAANSVAPTKKVISFDSSSVNFTSTVGDMILQNQGSIALVNTGNVPINYSATFAANIFKLRTFSGTINKDSSQQLYFEMDGVGDSVVWDTLVISNNSTNKPIIRIPFKGTQKVLTGMEQNTSIPFTFQLVPNPSNNEVNILSQNLTEYNISITTLQGQLLGQWDTQKTINTSLFQNGIYIVTLKTQHGMVQQKLIINHSH